jgi:hypothetical protein
VCGRGFFFLLKDKWHVVRSYLFSFLKANNVSFTSLDFDHICGG